MSSWLREYLSVRRAAVFEAKSKRLALNFVRNIPPVAILVKKADLALRRTAGHEVAVAEVTTDWATRLSRCSALESLNVTQVFQEMLMRRKVPDVLSNSKRR
ncbi:hypothetical protein MTO96_033016 [Rhipicephalus appendiculatus]